MFLVGVIAVATVYTTILVVIELVRDARLGEAFLTQEVLQDAFGSILTVLILLEFNHSVYLAVKEKTGAIQVKIVVLIAILAIARKLILLDYKSASLGLIAAIGGLLLALGIVYWLLADGDRRRRLHAADRQP